MSASSWHPSTAAVATAIAMLIALLTPSVAVAAPADLGSLDPSFGDHGIVVFRSACLRCGPASVAVQSDGRILVAMRHGTDQLRRLLPDGSADPTFGGGDGLVDDLPITQSSISDVRALDDGRILVTGAGPVGEIGSPASALLIALRADGSLDPSFGVDGVVAVQPFDAFATFRGVSVLPGGDLLAFGIASRYGGPGEGRYAVVARVTSDGGPVAGWGDNGVAVFTDQAYDDYGPALDASAEGVVPQPDGGVLVFDTRRYAWRLDPDGAPDGSFGANGPARTLEGVPAGSPDGSFLLTSRTYLADVGYEVGVRRYLADASPDPGFGTAGEVTFGEPHADDNAAAIALDPAGDALIGGSTTGHGTSRDLLVARVSQNGSLDTSVGIDGLIATDVFGSFDGVTRIEPMPDGRVVVVGEAYQPDTYRRFTVVGVYGPHDLDTSAPLATIVRPEPRVPYGRLGIRAIRGTSRDRLSGVTGTEAALRVRRPGGVCAWMGDTGWVDRPCHRPLWHDAGSRYHWAWELPRLLPRSIDARGRWYTAYARARDSAGNVEHRTVQGRNRVRFEVGLT